MVRDTVGLALAGVLAGLAATLFVASIAVQPFLVVAAIPFAAGAYLVWQASIGEYAARGVSKSEASRARARRARAANGRAASDGHEGTTADERRRSRNHESASAEGRRRASGRERVREKPEPLARREAARVLGVDADAEPAAVRSAYRERVKEVHPDTDGGDAETFQRVNDAYERLQEE